MIVQQTANERKETYFQMQQVLNNWLTHWLSISRVYENQNKRECKLILEDERYSVFVDFLIDTYPQDWSAINSTEKY